MATYTFFEIYGTFLDDFVYGIEKNELFSELCSGVHCKGRQPVKSNQIIFILQINVVQFTSWGHDKVSHRDYKSVRGTERPRIKE